MVFLITTARLGPGEIAPEAQTIAKIKIDLISNYLPFLLRQFLSKTDTNEQVFHSLLLISINKLLNWRN